MFHKVTIVGYLGREPEIRHTPEGTPVTTLRPFRENKPSSNQAANGTMRTKYFSKSGSRSKRVSSAAIALAVSLTPVA